MEPKKSKVKVLNNEYFQAKTAEQKLVTKLKKRRLFSRRLRLIVCCVIVVFIIYGLIRVTQAYIQIKEIKQETEIAKRELKRTKIKNKELKQKVEQLKDDDYLQKIIRSQYFYSKDGETIYILPDDAKD